MLIIQYVSVAMLVIAFLSQLFILTDYRLKFSQWLFRGSIAVIAALLAYYSHSQYYLWQGNDLTKLLFSDGPGFFLIYISGRFFAQYIVSLVMAMLILFAAKKYNQRHNNGFFYHEEPYLLALSVFLLGQPLWIVYFIAVIILYTLFNIGYSVKYIKVHSGDQPRVSFYYGWLPVALLVILMKGTLATIPFVQVLIFARDQFIL
jgi:hypothetical protein